MIIPHLDLLCRIRLERLKGSVEDVVAPLGDGELLRVTPLKLKERNVMIINDNIHSISNDSSNNSNNSDSIDKEAWSRRSATASSSAYRRLNLLDS